MDPRDAHCRLIGPSRPAATPLLHPRGPEAADQPVLPWSMAPEVVLAHDEPLAAELRQIAVALLNGVIELLRGQRSLVQLELWVDPEVLRLLEQLRRSVDTNDLSLRSVRVQSPQPAALEVCAHLSHRGASRAAALRIVRRRDRWVVSQLVLALAPKVVRQAGAGTLGRAS